MVFWLFQGVTEANSFAYTCLKTQQTSETISSSISW